MSDENGQTARRMVLVVHSTRRRHKCNKGKFGVRKGTNFDHSHFTIQTLLRIVYNFVCHLNEFNVKLLLVGEYYADCRQICTNWIWDLKHTPKLGGYGNVVEMDDSFFAEAPK